MSQTQAIDFRRTVAVGWPVLSALGLSLGLIAAFAAAEPLEALVGMMLVAPAIAAFGGLGLGGGQAAVLRRVRLRWRGWLAGTTLGVTLGLTVGVVAVEQIGRMLTGGQVNVFSASPAERIVSLAFVAGVVGATSGGIQWILLRRMSRSTQGWVWRSVIGYGVGFGLAAAMVEVLPGGLRSPLGLTVLLFGGALAAGWTTQRGVQRLL